MVQTYYVLRLRTILQHGDNPEHILVIDREAPLEDEPPDIISWLRRIHEYLRRPVADAVLPT